ncbi:MAG: 50S ribosomal protein L23 [Candidatus Aenigmarchaeota archaeon]|nr:50S ribosomal protein L23 [Candidatus Aenigmarchaeota archaeon]
MDEKQTPKAATKAAEKATKARSEREKKAQAKPAAEKPQQAQAAGPAAQPEEQLPVTGDPYAVLKFVVMTEKAVQHIERQNKLLFIVDRKANKQQIRQSAAQAFKANVSSVNTVIDQNGRKKAFIKFVKAGEAGEIAIRLGII